MRIAGTALLLVGCGGGQTTPVFDARERPPLETETTPSTTDPTDPTDTTETADTATPTETTPFPFDCDTIPASPRPSRAGGVFGVSEDFDFDMAGYVGVQYGGNLMARNRQGQQHVISAGVGNTAGTRVLSTGDWVIAHRNSGSFMRIDVVSGSQDIIASGFNWPNGIEVGDGDMLYVTDYARGEIWRVDAYDPEDIEMIASAVPQANGIALSPDEQTLYFTERGQNIMAIDRELDGTWGEHYILHDGTGPSFHGLNVDYCGNIYWSNLAGSTTLERMRPDGSGHELVAVLESGYIPNIRFGHGIDGWDILRLYASDWDGGRMFEIDVGVPGRGHVGLRPLP